MIDWTGSQARVTALIKKVGFEATLIRADGTTAKSYGVWDTSTKNDTNPAAAKDTANKKQMYLAASSTKIPVPGDYIKQGNDQFFIDEVEAYRPATITLAYRVVVI